MTPEEMQGLMESSKLKYARVNGWPVTRTKCKVCGEDIIYHLYSDPTNRVRAHPPKTHNGHCTFVVEQRKALGLE